MKGLSSYILALVITLILASIGLVLFWIFLRNTTEGAKSFSDEIIESLCNSIAILKIIGC